MNRLIAKHSSTHFSIVGRAENRAEAGREGLLHPASLYFSALFGSKKIAKPKKEALCPFSLASLLFGSIAGACFRFFVLFSHNLGPWLWRPRP
ncbi:hypothetical protein [Saprospira grandis]|uniref:hypothetical protein n=1 Tax=Saprospira grandis TaxID=1008 RepID=UPI0022DE25BB|nr:hypothetical protein [Saprospira grandis]WBM75528.1 hypothetical protein OP864_04635 [Saprospira grandis]